MTFQAMEDEKRDIHFQHFKDILVSNFMTLFETIDINPR